MPSPILLTVDDDPEVSRSLARDLRQQYGEDYRIRRAESGSAALDALKELKLRDENVGLLLADHRMPEMTGVEFLEQARELYPKARRVLLTAYADTDAAIGAINRADVDYYMLKPWDPPSERLYPQLDDLLDDWIASYRPSFEGIRVLGTRWSPRSYELRDFLARNHVPYQWIDLELSANDPETYPEDAPASLAEEAREAGYTFPYLFDETQEVAKAYHAACTPDFFLFGADRRLVYRGQFDDSRPGSRQPVTGADLRAAIDATLEGRPAAKDQVPSAGCSIKWRAGNEPD